MDTLLGAGAESVRFYYITAILRNSLLESDNVTIDRERERGKGKKWRVTDRQTDGQSQKLSVHREIK